MQLLRPQPLTVIAIILAAAASRLLPHVPNATPVAAIALFGGVWLKDRVLAAAVPLVALWLSDMALGLHSGMMAVYVSIALIAGLGMLMRPRVTAGRVAAFALTGSVLFFLITNFAVWLQGSLYPHTLEGLMACYVAGIPFFRNTLLGDLGYVALLFGGFELLKAKLPGLARA